MHLELMEELIEEVKFDATNEVISIPSLPSLKDLLNRPVKSSKSYVLPEIARLLGASTPDDIQRLADVIRKNWYKQIRSLYETFDDTEFERLFRNGQQYTDLMLFECEIYQRFRYSEYPRRWIENGVLVGVIRHSLDGPPVMEKAFNPLSEQHEPMSLNQYKYWRWENYPELRSQPEAGTLEVTDLAIIPEVYDAEAIEDFNLALDGFEEIGEGLAGLLRNVDSAADELGDEIGARFAKRLEKRVGERLKQVTKTLGSAMSGI
jgi:hypothetical protein